MSGAQMQTVVSLVWKGKTLVGLYWAGARFKRPGLYLWTGKRNVLILPWKVRS